MRVNAGFAVAIALSLSGCLGSKAVPAVTGSVHPPVDAAYLTPRPKPFGRTLADAVTVCLDRGTPVQTPAFRSCVTEARRSAAVHTEALAQGGGPVR